MHDINHAKEWINISERDYGVALHLYQTYKPMPTENICYGCQQSVEKSLKAVLAYNNDTIPKTHDISRLSALCQAHTDELKIDPKIARILTSFATESRYPDSIDFTKEDAELGLKYAEQILNKVKDVLKLLQGTQGSEAENSDS